LTSVARRAARILFLAALAASVPWSAARAGGLGFCDPPAELDATQQDTALRFGAIVKSTLEASGARLAIVARAGLDLRRFGQRYSHSGFSLRDNPNGPWSVRQLYFDCTEKRPRLFDEGIAGFIVGAGEQHIGWFSVVLLPGAEAPLEGAVRDNRRALKLLGATYSANAYAFGSRYQNCNQWVAEMLGIAWGGVGDGDDPRGDAQRWLAAEGYVPTRFESRNPLMIWLGATLPWLHADDHPERDLADGRFRVSMPESIEAFVRARVPGARRFEFCHADRRIVVREGWTPIEDGCVPGPGDTVVALDG
jgi:hypothetical protein